MKGGSVVIPCHGRADQLATIVKPLLDDPATLEIVVVADRDRAVERAVEALSHPLLRAVRCDAGSENGARQVGVYEASADVVLLIDDDVLPLPGLVSRHMEHDHRLSVVLGYMPVEPSRLRGVGRFPARVYQDSYQRQVKHWEQHPETILQKFWAGNFSARREDLIAVGIENPQYRGMYFADYDLGLRLHEAGISASFDRAAAGLHLYERDLAGYLRDCRRQGAAQAASAAPTPPLSWNDRLAGKLFLAGTLASSAFHNRRVERYLARRLRLVEQRVGIHAAQAGVAEAAGLLLPAGDTGGRRS